MTSSQHFTILSTKEEISYVGYTTKLLSLRIKEYLRSDNMSHIYKHMSFTDSCKHTNNENCVPILDMVAAKYVLTVK